MTALFRTGRSLQRSRMNHRRTGAAAVCRTLLRKTRFNQRFLSARRWLTAGLLLVGTLAQAGQVDFSAKVRFEQRADALYGHFVFTLDSSETLYQSRFELIGYGGRREHPGPRVWEPGETGAFEAAIPLRHTLPGAYFFLVSLEFQDRFGVPLGIVSAFPYRVGPVRIDPSPPRVEIAGNRLTWRPAGLSEGELELTLTGTPGWSLEHPLGPGQQRFTMQAPPRDSVDPKLGLPPARPPGLGPGRLSPQPDTELGNPYRPLGPLPGNPVPTE